MEIEIKLAPVTEAQFLALLADPAVAALRVPGEEITEMEATYYDDAPGNLAQRSYTLRLRRENGRGVCTVKAPAEGEFARLEAECAADSVEEGICILLEQGKLPMPAAMVLSRMLPVPTCGARFTRRAIRLQQAGFACILSYDQGHLFAGERTAPLAECEAELTEGTAEALQAFFLPLAERHGLPVCRASKHARAMALRPESC